MVQIPTETRCEGGKQHDFDVVIGGKGGLRCRVCGLIVGAMTDEEYKKKIFKKP